MKKKEWNEKKRKEKKKKKEWNEKKRKGKKKKWNEKRLRRGMRMKGIKTVN